MTIYQISEYGKLLEVVDNRIKVINYMLGYSRVGARDNPMRLVYDRGKYMVKLNDCEIVDFDIYDIDGIKRAIDKLDGMNDGIWCALGEGIIKVA